MSHRGLMGISLATNETAIRSQRYMTETSGKLNQAERKVQTGSRVNNAADDSAALSISENQRAVIRSLGATQKNTSDSISVIQVAEGAMSEVSNILIRMRELAMQSASDTVSNTEREFIQKEYTALKTEGERISKATEYNGLKLTDGSQVSLEFQVGINNQANESRVEFDRSQLSISPTALGYAGTMIINKDDARSGLSVLDTSINTLQERRSSLGALQNRLQSTLNNNVNYQENQSSSRSRLVDTEMAEETAEYTKQKINLSSNIAVASQANHSSAMVLKLLE